jgi:hypothetical protein
MSSSAEVEKRATRRFSLKLPVAVENQQEGPLPAETRDVSSRGVCFFMVTPVGIGADLDFTLTLPPEVTLTNSIQVHCSAHIVRVENADEQGRMAVAAVIDHYEFLPET